MTEAPVFSICIPVYNVEKYARECLDSVTSQTFTDFEVICVDDGSTDASGQICDEYAEKDPRFRVIHQENKGLLAARQPAFAAARGRYILVLDSDDKFSSPKLLEELFQHAEQEDVDILEFSIECFGADASVVANMQTYYKNKTNVCKTNYSMISECYRKNNIMWNVWARCYKSEVIKESIKYIEDVFLTIAEDMYHSFIFFYFSKSYKYINTKAAYCYRIGSGVTTQSSMELSTYKNVAQECLICGYIGTFLRKQNDFERYIPILEKLQKYFYNAAIYGFYALQPKDRRDSLDLLFRHHPVEKVLASLYERYGGCQAEFAASICGASCLESDAAPVHTIGIFYYRYYEGGVERVISLHIPMLQKQGFEVVLFTEDIDLTKEYPLPEGVRRVLLPKTYLENGKINAGAGRFDLLRRAIREYGIDLVLYHASSSPLALFDLMAVKTLKVKLIFIRHEPTARDLMWHSVQAEKLPFLYRLADKLVVLSRCEELFYRQMGVDAAYIQNPVFLKSETDEADHEKGAALMVLWLGRLEEMQKQYRDALAIMKRVLEKQTEAICVIIGGEDTLGAREQVEHFIEKNCLQGKLRYLPYTPDIASLYRQASVHLLTSRYEMFPMVVAESKSYGLPLVAYDLPTLEFFQDRKGMITVPQHDVDAAARAVVTLLENDELRQKMGREARESLEPYLAFDLPGRWKSLVEEVANKRGRNELTEEQRLSVLKWSELFGFYKTGLGMERSPLEAQGRAPSLGETSIRGLAKKTLVSLREYGFVETTRKVFRKFPEVMLAKIKIWCGLAGKTLRSLRENGFTETLRKIRHKLSGI